MSQNSKRNVYVFMAKLAEEAKRYEDMVEYVKKLAQIGVDATPEEKNLLSKAYKYILGERRIGWRTLHTMSQSSSHKQEYMLKIKKENQDICNDIINLISNHLLPATKDPRNQVFYYTLKGDYFRYISEVTKENLDVNQAYEAYKKVKEIAEEHLKPSDTIRLGLAVSFSSFYHEIMNSVDNGYKIAKKAYDDAVVDLDQMEDEDYVQVAPFLQLLRPSYVHKEMK